MKKITFYIIATSLLLSFGSLQLKAANAASPSVVTVPAPEPSAEAKSLLLRLNEINAMDKSNLKPSEKRDLRIEVRSIKHRLNEIGDGVYLSVGAIIIIVVLLIILL